jgi:hypothetical protein
MGSMAGQEHQENEMVLDLEVDLKKTQEFVCAGVLAIKQVTGMEPRESPL